MEKIKARKYELSSIVALLLGISTIVPAPASKPCLLGYYAHCSWTPLSTAICLFIAWVLYLVGKRRH